MLCYPHPESEAPSPFLTQYAWGIGSRTPHRYQNPRMFKPLMYKDMVFECNLCTTHAPKSSTLLIMPTTM
jgi:hypothetical protein